jgi:hydrogenase/urease accessory protein HupE
MHTRSYVRLGGSVRLDRMRRALVTSKFRPWLVTLTAGAAALALPSAASAHGLPGSGAEGVLDHLWLGIRHMLAGWDHLLFIAGVMIVAGRSRARRS